VLLLATPSAAQAFETSADHPGDPAWRALDYPVVFVSTRGQSDPLTQRAPHFGLDVISAANPAPMGPGGGLWVRLGDGSVRKLFPLPAHESAPGLIDTPLGALERGAVVEPNVSEDGRAVYFAWFHDAQWEPDDGGYQSRNVSYKGADLYRLDLGPLIDEPQTDPASLSVRRLTTKTYTGPAKANVQQAPADRFRDATNPALAAASSGNYFGTVDMHPIEMRTARGLRLVWVSNRARVGNSNAEQTDANHNFDLYVADLLPDGRLGPAQRFLHYTTTSALSPIPLRDGFAFSYQSSTEGFRRWDIQAVSSVGKWKPLIGYAHRSELFHLGTMVTVAGPDGPEDQFVGLKYYNMNDGGFGQMHRVALADAGVNRFEPAAWATTPAQLSELLTIGVRAQDGPSGTVMVNGERRYIGKFSSPRAGRLGGEYLAAYTPTSANTWLLDADGRTGVFESEIVYRPSLAPFRPHETVDPAQGKGLYKVVRDASAEYDLAWPTPLLSWQERHGTPTQSSTPSPVEPATPIARGLPFAEVGTSAIYNTDVRPYDCYLGNTGRPYDPNDISGNELVALNESLDGLRYVQNRLDFCQYLQPEAVLGIQVNVTSDKVDFDGMTQMPYETDGSGKKEVVRTLGVYSTLHENVADHSFMARIPARVPFEFHLLDSRYGMKLVDVRSWHSLVPRERRTDCGGCHQHEAGMGIAFGGTEASRKPALDLTSQTPHVAYDSSCRPVLALSGEPTLAVPEWRADVWPGFEQHCGGCHDSGVSPDAAALAAYAFDDEESAYALMLERNYANTTLGALGSPVFWAAYGERTDGRDNSLAVYAPDHAAGDHGYRFSPIHATSPGLCSAQDPVWADWVRTLGQWIDNHMPRDLGNPALGAKLDRYHPAVDFGLSDDVRRVRFGFWDDGDLLDVEVQVNGRSVFQRRAVPNGSFAVRLPLLAPTVRVKLLATDPAGNRQTIEKTLGQVLAELQDEP